MSTSNNRNFPKGLPASSPPLHGTALPNMGVTGSSIDMTMSTPPASAAGSMSYSDSHHLNNAVKLINNTVPQLDPEGLGFLQARLEQTLHNIGVRLSRIVSQGFSPSLSKATSIHPPQSSGPCNGHLSYSAQPQSSGISSGLIVPLQSSLSADYVLSVPTLPTSSGFNVHASSCSGSGNASYNGTHNCLGNVDSVSHTYPDKISTPGRNRGIPTPNVDPPLASPPLMHRSKFSVIDESCTRTENGSTAFFLLQNPHHALMQSILFPLHPLAKAPLRHSLQLLPL